MIGFDNMSVTLGQLVSYALGAGLTEVPHGWRYMVAIGGVPPILLAILLPWCPESPRQLFSHGKIDEAVSVIARVYPEASQEQLKAKADHIMWTIQVEAELMADKTLWWQFKQLHCVPSNLRALVAACAVMASTFYNFVSLGVVANQPDDSLPAQWFQYPDVLFSHPILHGWI